jgi:import inner membrane translocase subunit TIM54
VSEEEVPAGDIVIGRNTWKEYVRGLHEGWLGPLRDPAAVVDAAGGQEDAGEEKPASEPLMGDDQAAVSPSTEAAANSTPATDENSTSPLHLETVHTTDDKAEPKTDPEPPKPEEEKKKPEKRPQPPAFIDTKSYSEAALPPSLPNTLGPSIAVPYPVIFGFLNTPVRMWRFLNQRKLADSVGRQVAAAILASHAQYQQVERPASPGGAESSPTAGSPEQQQTLAWEQADLLRDEEWGWDKNVRKRYAKEPEKGSVWIEPVALDSRIASRMTKFVLPVDQKFEGEVSFAEGS